MKQDYSHLTALISQIHSTASDFLKILLEQDGLPELVSSHGNILFQLSRHTKLTMTELAERINRDKSTTTVLVRKLEAAGLVEREKSADDNRVMFIRLTAQGKSYTEATAGISKKLNSTGYAGFSPAEKETLFRLLEKVSRNFTDAQKNALEKHR